MAPETSSGTRPVHFPTHEVNPRASFWGLPSQRRIIGPRPFGSSFRTSENIATGAETSQELKAARHPANEQVTARKSFFAILSFL